MTAVDAVAPPDFVLNSSLGRSEGNLHDNIVQQILNADHFRLCGVKKQLILIHSPKCRKELKII